MICNIAENLSESARILWFAIVLIQRRVPSARRIATSPIAVELFGSGRTVDFVVAAVISGKARVQGASFLPA
jgi:hypothetical protein